MLRKKKVLCPPNATSPKEKEKKKGKGQSTIEYIILVAAVIAAILAFGTGVFKPALNQALSDGTNGMQNMAHRLSISRPLSP